MTEELKDKIARVVRDNIGVREAIAVYAALEISAECWTDKHTESYGTLARDIIK